MNKYVFHLNEKPAHTAKFDLYKDCDRLSLNFFKNGFTSMDIYKLGTILVIRSLNYRRVV